MAKHENDHVQTTLIRHACSLESDLVLATSASVGFALGETAALGPAVHALPDLPEPLVHLRPIRCPPCPWKVP
jgi:hypothetical protein